QEVEEALPSGSVGAFEIAPVGESHELVEQHPVGNTVAQSTRCEFCVIGEARSCVASRPASGIFESLRQIPVVEGDKRTDSGFEQGIDETAVIIDPLGIRWTGAGGLKARPGNRKPVAVQVHRLQERDVFAKAVIGIAGYVAGVAVLDFAGSVRETVPDRFALTVFIPCTFDLIGGGSCAPEETLGERVLGGRIELFRMRTRRSS